LHCLSTIRLIQTQKACRRQAFCVCRGEWITEGLIDTISNPLEK
jgi:hypothetical protein